MARAHQHEILKVAGKEGRPGSVTPRPALDIRNDVRDEAKDSVLATGDKIADQISVASTVLAAARDARPQCGLDLLRNAASRHQHLPDRCDGRLPSTVQSRAILHRPRSIR